MDSILTNQIDRLPLPATARSGCGGTRQHPRRRLLRSPPEADPPVIRKSTRRTCSTNKRLKSYTSCACAAWPTLSPNNRKIPKLRHSARGTLRVAGGPPVELAQGRALERRIREARLQGPACMEDIDFRAARGLDKQVVRSLMHESIGCAATNTFLVGPDRNRENVSRAGIRTEGLPRWFTAYFATAARCSGSSNWLGPTAATPRNCGSGAGRCADRRRLGMAPLADTERRAFLEICDERYLTRSTLLTASCQWPSGTRRSAIPRWPTVSGPAGARRAPDRITGESMRKKKGVRKGTDAE